MSRRSRKLLLPGVSLSVLVCVASVVLITRASSEKPSPASIPPRAKTGLRNLSLQPEALRVSRRLGKRFGPSARGTSVMVGTLKIGDSEQPMNLTRRQTQTGESTQRIHHVATQFARLTGGSRYRFSADRARPAATKAHFQMANEALLTAMEKDAAFATTMQQTGVNLQRSMTGAAPRTSPAGWTWHHAQTPGTMQLVPRTQHAPGSIFQNSLHPGGRGGFSLWGK